MAQDYSKLTPEQIREKFYEEYPEERPEVKKAMENLSSGAPVSSSADYSKLSPEQIKEKFYEEYPEEMPASATQPGPADPRRPTGFFGHLIHKDALPFAAGALQGAANLAPSIVNGVLSPVNYLGGTHLSIPYVNLLEDVNQSPESQTMGDIGALTGAIAGGGGLYKTMEELAEPAALAGKSALGSLAGYLSSGSDNDYDSAGRIAGTVLGGAAPVVSHAMAGSLANRLVAKKKELSSVYNNAYNNLFDRINQSDIGDKNIYGLPKEQKYKISTSYQKQLSKDYGSKTKDKLVDFFKNPTVKRAHEVSTYLFEKEQGLEKKLLSSKIKNPDQKDLYFKLSNARDEIRGKMYDFLKNSKNPEFSEQYHSLSDSYRRNFVPFINHNIEKFENKKISSRQLMKKILSDPDTFEKDNPIAGLTGLTARKNIGAVFPLLKKVGAGAALGLGATSVASLGIPGYYYLKQALEKAL